MSNCVLSRLLADTVQMGSLGWAALRAPTGWAELGWADGVFGGGGLC